MENIPFLIELITGQI